VQAILTEWCPALEDFFDNLDRLVQVDESSRCAQRGKELSPEETAAMHSVLGGRTATFAIGYRALFCKAQFARRRAHQP
jgi:hypothetical protein